MTRKRGATCTVCGKHGRGYVFHWDEGKKAWVCKQCHEKED